MLVLDQKLHICTYDRQKKFPVTDPNLETSGPPLHPTVEILWNSLPPSVVDIRSLSLFKKTIYNANLFTRYN